MVAGRGVVLSALLLGGCSVEEWRPADLQLDITGATWDTEDRARLCVHGVGLLEEAMAVGRIGYTGVPEDVEVVLTVDILADGDTGDDAAGVRVGRAGPVSFADGAWQTTPWVPCESGEDCSGCTTDSGGRSEEGGLLLAVRFQE